MYFITFFINKEKIIHLWFFLEQRKLPVKFFILHLISKYKGLVIYKNISINYLLSTEIVHFFVIYGKLLCSLLSPLHSFLPLLIQTTFSTLCRQSFSLFCWRKPGIICLGFFPLEAKWKFLSRLLFFLHKHPYFSEPFYTASLLGDRITPATT